MTTWWIFCFVLILVLFSTNAQKSSVQIYTSSLMAPLARIFAKEYSDDQSHENFADATISTSTIGLDRLRTSNNSFEPGYIDIASRIFSSTHIVTDIPSSAHVCFPVNSAGLAVLYNLGDSAPTTPLVVTLPILLGIYNGTINSWNHSLISQMNPTVTFPNAKIELLYRTDSCGSNYAISRIFSQYSSAYRDAYEINPIPRYPVRIPYFIPNSVSLIHYLDQIPNSITIMSLGVYRDPNSLVSRLVKLASVQGDYNTSPISPTVTNIMTSVSNSPSSRNTTFTNLRIGDFPSIENLDVANINFPSAYPLVIYSYFCVNANQRDLKRGSGVNHLIGYWYKYLNGRLPYDYGTLPIALQNVANNIYRNRIMCGSIPCYQYRNTDDFPVWAVFLILGSIFFIIFVILFLIGVLIYFAWRKFCRKKNKTYSPLTDPLLVNEISHQLSTGDRTKILYEDLTLEEQIGSGSFSEVYKGKWLGTSVAIKRMLVTKKDDLSDPIGDFIKETSIMHTMRHPNIVQYLGATIKSPHLYIITEFCDKGNVQTILRDKEIKMTVSKTVQMALDAAKGMLYLHSSKPPILHRDLKSANLFVDKNWTVKVGDFGLSRVLDTREMTVCGTAETCAPEVLSKNSYTEKADVFSFGIVFWEMLTREQLYPGMNFYELSSKVVNEGLRPNLTEHHFPDELLDLMKRCWDSDPTKRPGFDEIVDILDHFVEDRKVKLKKKKMKEEQHPLVKEF